METAFTPATGLLGGMLIGLAAVVLMAGIGRIAGISGITGAVLGGAWTGDNAWRPLFLLGLFAGAILMALLGFVDSDAISFPGTPLTTVIGGLLVGAGTALGSGCTSGHGVCGMSRLSLRSIVSTATFMGVAIITVFILRHVIGG